MCRVQRGARPQLLQDMIDLRKRLRGAPTDGTVSIVVTDIQGTKYKYEGACLAFWLQDRLLPKDSFILFTLTPPPCSCAYEQGFLVSD